MSQTSEDSTDLSTLATELLTEIALCEGRTPGEIEDQSGLSFSFGDIEMLEDAGLTWFDDRGGLVLTTEGRAWARERMGDDQ